MFFTACKAFDRCRERRVSARRTSDRRQLQHRR